MTLWSLLSIVHVVGLALAMGGATTKVVLLVRSRGNPAAARTYIEVARPITGLIILGSILLTASGIGWLLLGYPLAPRLVLKLVFVAAIWVMGPIIDNVFEPRFRRLVPAAGETPTAGFERARRQYLTIEVTATLLFYVIVVVWLAG